MQLAWDDKAETKIYGISDVLVILVMSNAWRE